MGKYQPRRGFVWFWGDYSLTTAGSVTIALQARLHGRTSVQSHLWRWLERLALACTSGASTVTVTQVGAGTVAAVARLVWLVRSFGAVGRSSDCRGRHGKFFIIIREKILCQY